MPEPGFPLITTCYRIIVVRVILSSSHLIIERDGVRGVRFEVCHLECLSRVGESVQHCRLLLCLRKSRQPWHVIAQEGAQRYLMAKYRAGQSLGD